MPGYNALLGLNDPSQVGAQVQQAFQAGMDRKREAETQKALYGYMQNPSEQNALLIGQHNPQLGFQVQQQEQQRQAVLQKQQQEAHQADLQRRAAQGDKAALAELAGIDLNAWDKLADKDKQSIKARVDYIGQAALAVSQLPLPQQAQAWDQYAMQGAQMFPELADQVGKFSPEALQGALASAGQVKTFLDLERPSYQVIPEGGTMVNTRDPRAVAQFGGQPQTAQTQNPEIPKIIQKATATGVMSPEEVQAVQTELGPNGQAAFQGFLQKNNIKIGKQVNGQTYFLVNGKWYDNPEGR